MFDAKKRKSFCSQDTTVEDLIEALKGYDPKATIGVDGDCYFYIHVEEDGSNVSIDSSSLDEEYLEWGNYEDLPEVKAMERI